MEQTYTFHPPRRRGTVFHHLSVTLLTLVGAWGIWQISLAQVGPQLLFYIFTLLVVLFTVPILVYRYYALRNSHYILKREGIYLQWGWRNITIPINQIKWIHHAKDLNTPLRPPHLRWPGAVLGKRKVLNASSVEFIASRTKQLIVIATADHYYAISPQKPDNFLTAYYRLNELGTLQHISKQSVRSTVLLSLIWQQKAAFYILLAGFLLNLTLLGWTLFIIPKEAQISLGFNPAGQPYDPIDSIRLILLPILNSLSLLANFFLGLFLFRDKKNKVLSYLLWGSSVFVALIFHISVYFITK